MSGKYLLTKRSVYWMPDRCGYTGLKREAGRYTEAEARALAHDGEVSEFSRSMKDLGVYMIAEERAPRFAPGCWPDVRYRELERLTEGALALVRKCIKAELTRRSHLRSGSVAAGYCDGRLEELQASLAELEGRS